MIDALKRASAKRITAVLPYYGYGRQTTKSHYQSPITAKLVADLISKAGPDRILTLDLHAGQVQGFYSCPVDALKSDPVILSYLRDKFPEEEMTQELVIVAPDAGSIKRASRMAARLDAKMALIDERGDGELHVVGDVTKYAVIVKDMIDTGSSVVRAAETLRLAGASDILVACTHALLSGDCPRRLNESVINEVIVTDSTAQIQDRELLATCPKLKVLSVASLMGEAIRRIHNEESVTALFRYE